MDDTVIREIANQLGMATDQAAQFIETYMRRIAVDVCCNAGAWFCEVEQWQGAVLRVSV